MALRNTDGTLFHIDKPNPIMVEQEQWDSFILHHKVGQFVTLPDTLIENIVEPEITVKTPNDPVEVWCLPASYKEIVDPLYGEKYRKITYGKKFMFEAVIVEQADVSIIIWTNTKAVTKGSIIYPRSNDKTWWRVEEIKEEPVGYLIYSSITDYQPDFSE